jgi:acetolactate synthase-1/2/3 large subunit
MGKIRGGRLVAIALKRLGIKTVFGLIGYQVTYLFDGCFEEGIQILDVRHEQAAVHMADGWAQVTGKVAVAITIGGPGFTNAISAILKAQTANTPLIVITGATEPYKNDMGAMQQIDHWNMVKDYVKWTALVPNTERIPEYIYKAVQYAVNGKPGVVVLSIPVNVLSEGIELDNIKWPSVEVTSRKVVYPENSDIKRMLALIQKSERPIIIAGSGILYSQASEELKSFVEATGIPIYTINAGRGSISDYHELSFGLGRPLEGGPQLYGFKNADTVIIMGLKLNFTIGYGKPPVFGERQSFIQIDIDPDEIGRSGRFIDIGIVGDLKATLKLLLDEIKNFNIPSFKKWINDLRENEKQYWEEFKKTYESSSKLKINPIKLISLMQSVLPDEFISVVDGSNSLFWGLLLLKCTRVGHQLIGPSGILGPMGSGLPLALGAKVAMPDKFVLLYTGDGSLGFNLAEVDTAIRLGIKILIVVHNDGAWGLPKDTQKRLFSKNYAVDLGITRYDKIVECLGGHGEYVDNEDEIVPALQRAMKSEKLACVNVVIDENIISPGSKLLSLIETDSSKKH